MTALHRYLSRLHDTILSRHELQIEELEVLDRSDRPGQASEFYVRIRFPERATLSRHRDLSASQACGRRRCPHTTARPERSVARDRWCHVYLVARRPRPARRHPRRGPLGLGDGHRPRTLICYGGLRHSCQLRRAGKVGNFAPVGAGCALCYTGLGEKSHRSDQCTERFRGAKR